MRAGDVRVARVRLDADVLAVRMELPIFARQRPTTAARLDDPRRALGNQPLQVEIGDAMGGVASTSACAVD